MQQICRLCLQAEQRDVTPLFRNNVNDNECRELRLQIADLCSIVILQNDNLPKLVCYKCKIKLRDAHEFINLCKTSNDKLHERYEKNKHCQNTLNVEIAKTKFNNNDRSDFESKIQEISSKKQVTLKSKFRQCCNGLSDNNEKQYLCDVCSKTFASKTGLRFHLKSHHGSKPHTCQYCNKSFTILSYKKRHEVTHTGNKPFVCHICSTAFASSNGLKYHLRNHTGEANHRCSLCGKSFARYKYLKEHIFTHTGEKPFVCKLCGSAYGNSGSLFVHEKKCKSRRAKHLESDYRDNNDSR